MMRGGRPDRATRSLLDACEAELDAAQQVRASLGYLQAKAAASMACCDTSGLRVALAVTGAQAHSERLAVV